MKDFIVAALPFVIIGICLAIMFVNHHRKKKKGDAGNYLTEGMCLGMCMGVTASAALHFSMGLGISLGMLVGEVVGLMMKKQSK